MLDTLPTEDQLLAARIGARADVQPESLAVCYGDRTWTYRQLWDSAGGIAGWLSGQGVGAGARVGVLGQRSMEFIAGCLGVLRAGAAFVPMDARWPADRVAGIARRAGLAALLHQGQGAPPVADTPTLDLDHPHYTKAAPPEPHSAALAPMYLIFTSGSTGIPKGVVIHHAAFVNFLEWMCRAYPLGPGTRTAWTSRPGFDASLFEIWPTLSLGGTLVIPNDQLLLDPEGLIQWITGQALTTCFLATPLCELVLDLPWPGNMPLRFLLTGGDALRRSPPPELPFRLFDHYGPSECTILATFKEVPPSVERARKPVIGHPLPNVTITIRDEQGKPVAPGAIGEITIGGAAVGLGYWNDATLTQASFGHASTAGAPYTHYRTGDLGRLLPDGEIEFHGRRDHQVKIRGYRIELGEIERLLMALPGIEQCAVVVAPPPGQTLVAFASPPSAQSIEWRAPLARHLPDYMIPERLVALDRLPENANGKIDRLRLASKAGTDTDGAVPAQGVFRTPAERRLAKIWSDILGHTRFGPGDSFFNCGGHSLAAAMVAGRIRTRWAPGFGISQFIQTPVLSEQAALIERMTDAPPSDSIAWRSATGPIPATPGQQHMWLLGAMDGGLGAAHIVLRIELIGHVNPALVTQALRQLADRHTLLASAPRVSDRNLEFVAAEIAAEILDPTDAQNETDFRRLLTDLSRLPWPEGSPLWRAQMVHLPGDRWVLAWILHHTLADGWSAGILLRELGTIYHALSDGHTQAALPPAGNYAAYSDWLRRWLASPAAASQRTYWTSKLADMPGPLSLRRELPRPPRVRFCGRRLPLEIETRTWQATVAYAAATGTTPVAPLLAAMGVVLRRESGRLRFCVGMPMANRTLPQAESVVGLIMNSVSLTYDFRRMPTFRALVSNLGHQVFQALDNQTLPFEWLVRDLDVPREAARHPVFQHGLIFQNAHERRVAAGPVEWRLDEVGNDTSRLDLTFCFEAVDDKAVGWMEYNTDLFSAADANQIAASFLNVLKEGIAEPTAPPRVALGPDISPWTMAILRQARERPAAPALLADGSEWSYADLERATAVQAAHLADLGLAQTRIGVMATGVEFILAALAIARTMSAYVPLDPENPRERTLAAIEDAEVAYVLCGAGCADRITGVPAETMDLPTLRNQARPDWQDRAHVPAEQEAYVLFTSGSTGRPNGVIVAHANLNHLVRWQTAFYGMTPSDRASHLARACFDTSVSEIWPALASGATVCVPPSKLKLDPPALIRWLQANRITICDMTTPLAELCLPLPWPQDSCLRVLKTGGDRLRIRPRTGLPFRFFNEYGPTECTVISTVDEVEPGAGDGRAPTIGRPIAGAVVRILDEHGRPAPTGTPGELCIGGSGVALGYADRAELTAARFARQAEDGHSLRWYRSGDRAAWRDDGRIDFLGRIDHQIQVRGFRVEPGEIEARMASHPGVTLACVTADDSHGDTRLVGWWSGAVIDAKEWQAFLGATLPDYMIPSDWRHRAELPLNQNGKLDRRALMEQTRGAPTPRRHINQSAVASDDPIEQTLATIWSELLDGSEIRRDDRFFDLGGHSILAIQMLAGLRRHGLHLNVEALFENPTLAEAAAQVRLGGAEPAVADHCIVPLGRGRNDRPPLFLLHSLPGDIMGYGDLVRSLGPEQTCYGIQSLGLTAPEQRHHSVPDMATHYAAAVAAVCPSGPLALCGWCFGGYIAIEMAQRLLAMGRTIAMLALIEAPAPPPPPWFAPYYLEVMRNAVRMGPAALLSRLRSRRALRRTLLDSRATIAGDRQIDEAGQKHVTEYVRNRQPVYEANRAAGERYRSHFYDGDIDLFTAAERMTWLLFGEQLGWRTLTRLVRLHRVAGDHRGVLHGAASKQIAAIIHARLSAGV
jgi:amino acid adenylation domain-containing protein